MLDLGALEGSPEIPEVSWRKGVEADLGSISDVVYGMSSLSPSGDFYPIPSDGD